MSVGVRLALAGDTMLGRKVADALRARPPESLVSGDVIAVLDEADLFVLNLECCISDRGERWPDPSKPFFFRAPLQALALLHHLGVDCVTVANNHALDYGRIALLDTLDRLSEAGVAAVGAGRNLEQARRSVTLESRGFRLRVVGLTDHPREYQAGADSPGVAYADLRHGVPDWLFTSMEADSAHAVLVTPHWGPNMTKAPNKRIRQAAEAMVQGGATLVAGHSAHVFHGVSGNVLYDLGDFLDDYSVDPLLRNDLGMLFLVDLTPAGPVRLEAVPLALDFCHTRLARGEEAVWIRERFAAACAELGTEVVTLDGRSVIEWRRSGAGYGP
jgi:poly-gamma-glutamate capsule biosynthesis protein CapA/YwtB (metallophosphatase superfamily)